MKVDDRAIDCRILARHDWAPHLFSLRVERPAALDFVPGQFVRLGVVAADGERVWRAYSIASGPTEATLEFYSIVVPDGPFTPALARLGPGDAIRIDPTVYGFLRIDRFVDGRHLWLLATGTGIAPFRAILAAADVWDRFEEIVLVHSVRTERELAYREDFERWAAEAPHPAGRLRYLPTLTTETAPGTGPVSRGRITTLLASGELERSIGLTLSLADSRLMIACNPSMIKETRALLGARGMAPVRRETPGQYIAENFW